MTEGSMIITIDPGRVTGVACGDWHTLKGCVKLRPDMGERPPVTSVELIVAELPVLTPVGPGSLLTRGNDLITLAVRLGRLLESVKCQNVRMVAPGSWKGQVPKSIHNQRVLTRLSLVERTLVLDDHNVIDAIGLFLHTIGRMK